MVPTCIAKGQAILSDSDDYDEISPGQFVTIVGLPPTEIRAAIQDLPGGVVESFSRELGLYKTSFPDKHTHKSELSLVPTCSRYRACVGG